MQITIEIPDDTPHHLVEHLKHITPKLIDPDYLSTWWNISDVFDAAETMGVDLSVQQAQDVLSFIRANHDASVGVNWEVIELAIERIAGG